MRTLCCKSLNNELFEDLQESVLLKITVVWNNEMELCKHSLKTVIFSHFSSKFNKGKLQFFFLTKVPLI